MKVLIVLPIISLLPGGGGGRWPSMPFLLWSRHGKVSHTPSSLVKDLLLPGHSFPIWNDRLRAGPTDTLCTGWLWWQQASPNQCPLSPGSDEPHGGWWSRLSVLSAPPCLALPISPPVQTGQGDYRQRWGQVCCPQDHFSPAFPTPNADGHTCPLHTLKTPY